MFWLSGVVVRMGCRAKLGCRCFCRNKLRTVSWMTRLRRIRMLLQRSRRRSRSDLDLVRGVRCHPAAHDSIALDIGEAKHSCSQFRWYQPRLHSGRGLRARAHSVDSCGMDGVQATEAANSARRPPWCVSGTVKSRRMQAPRRGVIGVVASLVASFEIFGSLKALWTSQGTAAPSSQPLLPRCGCQTACLCLYLFTHCEAASPCTLHTLSAHLCFCPRDLCDAQLACRGRVHR